MESSSNPFRFGAVATGDFFTDRKDESKEVLDVLDSGNHLILISPRRYGKTSLIRRVTGTLDRPVIYLDLQLVTDIPDFATQLLKRVLNISKWENVKRLISNFRVMPTIELNPLTNGVTISFQPSVNQNFTPLEDVLGVIEKIGERGARPIVVLDEFQEVAALGKDLQKQLRSVMQHHAHVNYVFLGSVESMMRRIFEVKKSPFYHFGHLMTLRRIPYDDFYEYLKTRFAKITDSSDAVSKEILAFTGSHPYYTQQLAFFTYARLEEENYREDMLGDVIGRIVEVHDNDFERIWNTMSRTDKRVLIALADGEAPSTVAQPTSTVYSSLRRLSKQGYVIKNASYKPDDPFFASWIVERRAR
jgi:AAA+ ATPase superfamily predicted ATPase